MSQKLESELEITKQQNEILRELVSDQSYFIDKLKENRGLVQKILAECRDFMLQYDLNKKDKHLLQIVHYCIDDCYLENMGESKVVL